MEARLNTDHVDATDRRALIVVDVQNDFVTGSLATATGAEVASRITDFLRREGTEFDHVVGTRDWHIDPEGHFAPAGEEPDYHTTWPVHCLAETHGAATHENLDESLVGEWFLKGQYTAAYSGFEGVTPAGASLRSWLEQRGVSAVSIVGIATDFCVKATALDAVTAGYETEVIADLCAPVTEEGGAAALAELRAAGVDVR